MYLIPAIFVILFSLYWFGLMPFSIKRSVTFLGTGGFGRSSMGASFTSCSGTIYKIVRFRESRSYSFQLTGQTRKGAVSIQILDPHGTPLLILDARNPSGVIYAEERRRYQIRVRFQNASGDYQLEWT